METIEITIYKDDVYEEVAKATDYTGAKLIDGDANARDRILATDSDLSDLSRFWEEAVLATNERLKEMLVSGATKQVTQFVEAVSKETEAQALPPDHIQVKLRTAYVAKLEVSKSFDKELAPSVQSTLRNFFIFSIIGQWYKLANKGEAADNFTQAEEMMSAAERLLYSRKKPTRPK